MKTLVGPKPLAVISFWVGLVALVLMAQDGKKPSGPHAPPSPMFACDHGTHGDSRPIELNLVGDAYKKIERTLSASFDRQESKPVEIKLDYRFDSGLKRLQDGFASSKKRRVKLPRPIPKFLVGAQLVVGELRDLADASKRENSTGKGSSKTPAVVYLLTRVSSARELVEAREKLRTVALGVATPELVRYLGITSYPVRIRFEEPEHASIEHIED